MFHYVTSIASLLWTALFWSNYFFHFVKKKFCEFCCSWTWGIIQVISKWSGGKDCVPPKIPMISEESLLLIKNILNSSILLFKWFKVFKKQIRDPANFFCQSSYATLFYACLYSVDYWTESQTCGQYRAQWNSFKRHNETCEKELSKRKKKLIWF